MTKRELFLKIQGLVTELNNAYIQLIIDLENGSSSAFTDNYDKVWKVQSELTLTIGEIFNL